MTVKSLSRVLLLALALLLVLGTLTACSSPVASPRAGRVVATADGEDIFYDDLYFLAMNRIAEQKKEAGEAAFDDPAAVEELERFVWENLVTRELALISIGREYGLDVHKGDIAREVQAYIDDEMGGDKGAYTETLNAMYMTDRYLRSYVGAREFLPVSIVTEMLKREELDTSDETAKERLEKNFIRTVHVVIEKNNKLYSEAENAAHIAEIQASVAAGATPEARYDAMLEAMGGKYNNDFTNTTGHGYYFTKGEMEKAYEDAAFALKDHYDVSDVVETDKAYYVIMLMPKEEAYIRDHFEELKHSTYFVELNEMVEERLAEMELEKTRFGEKLDLLDLAPISANGGLGFYIFTAILGTAAVTVVVVLVVRRVLTHQKATRGSKKK